MQKNFIRTDGSCCSCYRDWSRRCEGRRLSRNDNNNDDDARRHEEVATIQPRRIHWNASPLRRLRLQTWHMSHSSPGSLLSARSLNCLASRENSERPRLMKGRSCWRFQPKTDSNDNIKQSPCTHKIPSCVFLRFTFFLKCHYLLGIVLLSLCRFFTLFRFRLTLTAHLANRHLIAAPLFRRPPRFFQQLNLQNWATSKFKVTDVKNSITPYVMLCCYIIYRHNPWQTRGSKWLLKCHLKYSQKLRSSDRFPLSNQRILISFF